MWEGVNARTPIASLRWVLVHLNVATARDIARIRRLGAVVTTNPISYLWRSAADELSRIGGVADTLLPHRSLVRARVPVALATDNKPPDPWLAFRAVVARQDMDSGAVLGPAERLSRHDALRALTVAGAWLTFAEHEGGVLAVGRRADLAVLDRDPLSVPIEELSSLSCRLTMVGGRIVHGDA